ncbi:hypothetical protein BC939DRAFT_421918, partial [Gamsiella multidivaricata]|uniref:uncharacterized protein n=1 Tax=Gamsiella multidivaricata TaxID=101098 RepID=UPI002220E1E3
SRSLPSHPHTHPRLLLLTPRPFHPPWPALHSFYSISHSTPPTRSTHPCPLFSLCSRPITFVASLFLLPAVPQQNLILLSSSSSLYNQIYLSIYLLIYLSALKPPKGVCVNSKKAVFFGLCAECVSTPTTHLGRVGRDLLHHVTHPCENRREPEQQSIE